MKSLLSIITLSLSLLVTSSAFAVEHEQKKVCEFTKDAKTGKQKQVCKTVKIHKKLDVESTSK